MYESEARKIVFDLEPLSKFFIPHDKGGYNLYTNVRYPKKSDSLLPNCTGGAFGLAMQLLGTKDGTKVGLPKNHAKYWWTQFNGTYWRPSKFPVIGAIACWTNSGNGHVGMCVDLERDSTGKVIGTPTILESSYYSYSNKDWRRGKTYKYNVDTGVLTKTNYKFQGWLVPVCVELDPITPPTPAYKYAVGDKIRIEAAGNSRADGTGKTSYGLGYKRFVLEISENSKYPYLVGNKNGVATGWYAENALSLLDHSEPAQTELKVGDKVEIIKPGNARKDGEGKTSYGLGLKRYILKVHEGAEYPYQLGNILRITTGYYKEDAIKKV